MEKNSINNAKYLLGLMNETTEYKESRAYEALRFLLACEIERQEAGI